ncbi:hypothetical protein HDU96_004804 [Phlyctochytrium bullatum]|nr:hypothetical protein HDU96_004804 [Phlyctochytrium bullatum]
MALPTRHPLPHAHPDPFSELPQQARSKSAQLPISGSGNGYEKELKTLRDMFGDDWTAADLVATLEEVKGDVESAAARIVEGNASRWGKVKNSKPKTTVKKSETDSNPVHIAEQKSRSQPPGHDGRPARGGPTLRGGRNGGRGGGRGGRSQYPRPPRQHNGYSTAYEASSAAIGQKAAATAEVKRPSGKAFHPKSSAETTSVSSGLGSGGRKESKPAGPVMASKSRQGASKVHPAVLVPENPSWAQLVKR